MDSGFLVDASHGGVVVFLVDLLQEVLVVVVFMCIKSVYLSYDTTSIIMYVLTINSGN